MLHSLALVHSDLDLYDKAGDYLTQAQTIAEECDDMELYHACNHIFCQLSGKK
jgi:hypothetical protein